MNFARLSRVRADDTSSKITGSSGWTTGTASSGNSRTLSASGLKNEVILGRDCIDVTSSTVLAGLLLQNRPVLSNFFFCYFSCCGSLKFDTNAKIRNKLSPICIVELRQGGAMNIIRFECFTNCLHIAFRDFFPVHFCGFLHKFQAIVQCPFQNSLSHRKSVGEKFSQF
jgi:hypothetical protein